jgi:mono/diheme cytochrome c family protein
MRILSTIFIISSSALAVDPAGVAFFEQKVRPVLVEHCYSCHSAEAKKLKGNLYLDSKAGWEKGGDSGEAVIVPGKPESSLLIRTVQHIEEDMKMPPKKPKMPDAVIADLVAWVKMGAPDPRDGAKVEAKRGDKSWWSLQPLRDLKSQIADFKSKGLEPIDGFITAKLAEKKLTLNPPADPRALIRRMTYDGGGDVCKGASSECPPGRRGAGGSAPRVTALRRTLGAALAGCHSLWREQWL